MLQNFSPPAEIRTRVLGAAVRGLSHSAIEAAVIKPLVVFVYKDTLAFEAN